MLQKLQFICVFICFLFGLCSYACASSKLYYPKPETNFDERTGYPLQLLRLAFKNSKVLSSYELEPSEMVMPRGRSLKLVEKGLGVDVFWGISTKQRESDLASVNFDIFKRLFGYRLLLIKSEQVATFKTLEHNGLKTKVAGMSPDWPDYAILENNNYKVQGTSSYGSLFKLLELGRVDYLPRSIFEVWSELNHIHKTDIVISPDVALHYPTKFTFFFGKDNKNLAIALQESLQDIESDGRFDEFFQLVWGDVINKSALQSKTVFELSN